VRDLVLSHLVQLGRLGPARRTILRSLILPWVSPSERDLREALAADPELIEPNLKVVGQEIRLPNAQGTRGSIDILARDGHGYHVVIELKRSDNSAREALHELFKYVQLLHRERGLQIDRIRCILISTDWNELRVPFAAAALAFPCDLRGLHLEVDEAGRIRNLSTVLPLAEPSKHGITLIQRVFCFDDAAGRDALFSDLVPHFENAHCPSILGVRFDNQHPKWPGYRHLLYLVVGRATWARQEEMMADIKDHDFSSDALKATLGFPVESDAVESVPRDVMRRVAEIEIGYAEKAADLVGGPYGWVLAGVERSGIFLDQQDIVTDEELVADVCSFDGGNRTVFGRRFNPNIRGATDRVLREISSHLEPIPMWRDGLTWWLSEHADAAEITIDIFTPYDLPGVILKRRTEDDIDNRLPVLAAYDSGEGSTPPNELLFGELIWNGTSDAEVVPAFEAAYTSAFLWNMASSPESDREFLQTLGIEYALFVRSAGEPPQKVEIDGTGSPTLRAADDAYVNDEGSVTIRWDRVHRMTEFWKARGPELETLTDALQRSIIHSFDDHYWSKVNAPSEAD
jgi:hypothetical protein